MNVTILFRLNVSVLTYLLILTITKSVIFYTYIELGTRLSFS